jgi:hypothetical protein
MFADASLVIPVSANAFTFRLLFVLPMTWPFVIPDRTGGLLVA